MFGIRNIKGPGSSPGESRPSNDKKFAKLTRPEIIGVLNAIIDLYIDMPMKTHLPKAPKTGGELSDQIDKLKPLNTQMPCVYVPVVGAPRVPRVPDKLVLPKDKRRGDAILDTLDTLRTYVKYREFDCDALRREVTYLKGLVKDLGGDV